jgi:CubicO group peptidase (beta-lactamase class C family)
VADRRTGRRITPDDPIRVASVSKIATALVVMRLVEQGKLDLDADVSAALGWSLRNPAFPDRPITLRMLLSHTGSVQDNGENYVVRLGKTLRRQAQDPGSFDQRHAPGTFFRYSNLNFGIVGSVVERATGERFDRVARREVLEPLGLDACFNWGTCSEAAAARAVVLYDEDGSAILDDLQGKLPPCPVFVEPGTPCTLDGYEPGSNGALFSPQGGLRISAAGLTVIGRLLLNGGRHRGRALLSPASVRTMIDPGLAVQRQQWRDRRRLLLLLRPCHPPHPRAWRQVPGRPDGRRAGELRPRWRSLSRSLGLVDRPQTPHRHRLCRRQQRQGPAGRPTSFKASRSGWRPSCARRQSKAPPPGEPEEELLDQNSFHSAARRERAPARIGDTRIPRSARARVAVIGDGEWRISVEDVADACR